MEKNTMQVSPLQELLGKVVAKYPSFMLGLGKLETQWLKDSVAAVNIDRPIYVTGLARSGTTILLELLASHPDVASHKYRDFPLVHVPYWWNWFVEHASSGAEETTERAHKDRILVSPESPEAMEEIFWMTFFPASHDSGVSQVLAGEDRYPEFEAYYCNSIRKLLMARKATRYLSKGNYNISRIAYLGRLFDDARFVIPVRQPAEHIASLMKQHRLFCEAESHDPKVLAYMQRAGHFEFGLDLRPINFGNAGAVERIQDLWGNGQAVRGWAAYWSSVYSFIADLFEKEPNLANRMLLVHYTEFCNRPAAVLRTLYAHCELAVEERVLEEQAARISAPSYYKTEFSRAELEAIDEETGACVERIQRLLAA
jgi:sulfotransferase family protein